MNSSFYRGKIILLSFLSGLLTVGAVSQQTLTKIYGLNAYVHLPDDYNQTNKNYPVIIFFPGSGETGTDAVKLLRYGPSKFIADGHNMQFTVNGVLEKPIVISIQPIDNFPPPFYLDIIFNTVMATWRIDPQRFHVTGLSMGGFCANNYVTQSIAYASRITSIVAMSAIIPNNPISNFTQYALEGGKWWGFEGIYDYRSMDKIRDVMNAAVPGSARYTSYVGGHAGWNQWYDPDYEEEGLNIYEWMLQHTKSGNTNANQLPVANAGADQTITLPANSFTLNANGSSDPDGNITKYLWEKISGPSQYQITSSSSAITTVTNFQPGTYVFELTVTDNKGESVKDQVSITVNEDPDNKNCNCDITLKPSNGGTELFIDGDYFGVKPGYKVCIKGGLYQHIYLLNFNGTPEKPITIINCTGQVKISGNGGYGFIINRSKNIHVTGTGDPSHTYGFLIDGQAVSQSVAFAMSDHTTDMELDHIEINKTGAGFIYAPTPNCDTSTWGSSFTIRNLSLHHNYVHDNTGEAFYLGNTSNSYNLICNGSTINVKPQVIHGLKIYDNLIERCGWDGIQVASAPVGVEIYNNVIKKHGVLNRDSQQAGIILGGASNGKVYNNLVLGGTGNSFQCFGIGVVKVYNNVFADGGYDNSALGQHGVIISSRPIPDGYDDLSIQFINNTIVNPRRGGVVMYNEFGKVGTGNIFSNNVIAKPGALLNLSIYAYWDVALPAKDVQFLNNIERPTLAALRFADTLNSNFELLPGSVAINAGADVSGYGITKDLKGRHRPFGNAFDVGAYESHSVNQSPVAKAGPDITISLPTNTLTLSGAGTDVDGFIASYAWTKIKGSKQINIVKPNAAVTVINGLEQGAYELVLTVTDNQGLKARDTVVITVNSSSPVSRPKKIENSFSGGLGVYPNPASGLLNIRYASEKRGKGKLTIYDASGRIVYAAVHEKQTYTFTRTVNIANLTAGLYMAEFTFTDGRAERVQVMKK